MLHDLAHRIPIWTIVSFALAACGESASPDTGGGRAGSTTTGTGGGAGLGTTVTSSTSGATGGGGSSGTTTGNGGTSGGGVEMDAAGGGGEGTRDASRADAETTNDARVDVADASAESGFGSCPPPGVICDDFEKYPSGSTNLSPDWITYTYSGAIRVDTTKPRAGKQSLHVTTQAGMRHYADIIRETRGKEIMPRNHYGRLMIWITAIPPASHWNVNISSGPMIGAPDEMAKFGEGGMFGKLMSNYAQRMRAIANGVYLLRGGGPENGDPGPEADCAVAAPNQTIAAGKWVCWEWQFNGLTDEAHLWLDGQAMTDIDAVKNGKQCQGPGFMGRPMTASYRWESPQVFDKLIIGWEQYQDTPAQEVWIDDVVVGSERVGCPAP